MTDTPPVPSVVAPVKSPWASSVNWAQLGGLLASLMVYLKVPLDASQIASILISIQTIVGLFTWVKHTWFERDVLTSSVENSPKVLM